VRVVFLQRLQDPFANGIRLRQHFVVPEPEDAVALGLDDET
jgi:hypothetical protein